MHSRGVGMAGADSICVTLPASLLPLQQSLLTMEEIESVEETQVKERKCILLKIRGGKQFILQCDVSVTPANCTVPHSLAGYQPATLFPVPQNLQLTGCPAPQGAHLTIPIPVLPVGL